MLLALESGLIALALFLPISIAATNIALGLVTAALLTAWALGARPEWRKTWGPAGACLCLYCAISLLTSLTGIAPAVSLHQIPKDLHKLWVFFLLVPAMRLAPMRRLPVAMALGFAFVAVYGIVQFAFAWDVSWMRAHAFVHPVTYGEMIALGLLGGLAFLSQSEPGISRRTASVFLALLLAALILSKTRGALMGLAAGLAVVALSQPAWRRWVKWGILATVLGWLAQDLLRHDGSLLGSLRHEGAVVGANQQLNRFILWDAAWRMFRDHPWLGVGPSNYRTAFAGYVSGMVEGQQTWGTAHNLYLHQLAERGLIGLSALLALIAALLARAWQRARQTPNAWTLWALGTTAAFFTMNITETAFQNEQIATLFLFSWLCAEAARQN